MAEKETQPDSRLRSRKQESIAAFTIAVIALHLILRFAVETDLPYANIPLWMAFLFGGIPLVYELMRKAIRRQFGSDLLAGISIITAVILGEYLAGTLVILMLSGGAAIEAYAIRGASSVLRALASRMPTTAHRQSRNRIEDIEVNDIEIGNSILIYPHEICPVDGTVIEGHSAMDESYLTGEPYVVSKTPGAAVISGALNGDSSLTIRAAKKAVDSRYAKIMEVMRSSEQQRPRMRRLGDKLGAVYTPVALALAAVAWAVSGDPIRFLSVLVIATPCPLLIGIPVTIIGSISLAAKRAIVIRDPAILESISTTDEVIFDKTGTLTYGRPELVGSSVSPDFDPSLVLSLTASVEQYSKHPLSNAIQSAARKKGITLHEIDSISENPGEGLTAEVAGKEIKITGRGKLRDSPEILSQVPDSEAGNLECIVLIDGKYAATYRFRDIPRADTAQFVEHLHRQHGIENVMLLSGDRSSEARHLARLVGIPIVEGDKSPEEKLAIVRERTAERNTVYVGDGINDAPALMAATVGIAFGKSSDVTAEAAGAVIMDSSLRKLDELFHIGARMRRIALQSAVGGMILSIVGMFFAAAGHINPVTGAILQEVIDVFAILNALRAALPPKALTDY